MRSRNRFAEFHRIRLGPEEFRSEAFDRDERLRAFSKFVYGESLQNGRETLFTSLSDSNENFTNVRRPTGERLVVSRKSTAGYVVPPGMHFSDAVTINVCLSGNASLGSDQIKKDDIYINLSKVCPMQFGPGGYLRLMLPKGHLTAQNVKRNQLLIFRRDDPVNQIIRSSAEAVEDAIVQGSASQMRTLEGVMVSVTQRILENALESGSNAGYSHFRDRAMEYIRDNLHRAELSVSEIANFVGVSRATLYRAFESVGGIKHFITAERISLAISMLKLGNTGRGQICAVAYSSGFLSPDQFSKAFRTQTGLSPTKFLSTL